MKIVFGIYTTAISVCEADPDCDLILDYISFAGRAAIRLAAEISCAMGSGIEVKYTTEKECEILNKDCNLNLNDGLIDDFNEAVIVKDDIVYVSYPELTKLQPKKIIK